MKRQTCLCLSLLCTALVLNLIGCRNTSESAESPDPDVLQADSMLTADSTQVVPESADVPSDFSLVLGQGGGYTGQWTGYTVQADGTVLRWTGPFAEANPVEVGMLPQEEVRTLWGRLNALNVFETDMEERGNMTAMLKVSGQGRSHRLSWIPALPELESPKNPIDAFYRECRTLLAQYNP